MLRLFFRSQSVLFFLCGCYVFTQQVLSQKQAYGQTYYVSSAKGNDANLGTSPQQPWKSLDKVNELELLPGQSILFKSGDSWDGQLTPKGSGTAAAPIHIGRYGCGDKPQINGQGGAHYTLLLKNNEHITVSALEITNEGPISKAGRVGVLVQAIDIGERYNICLDSLTVHHVNGSLVKAKGGGSGIFWQNAGKTIKSRFVGLTIKNCHIYNTHRNGITSSGYANRDHWFPSLGVVIKHNLIEDVPGDGIVPIGTDGALISHNVMRNSPDILPFGDAAAGIWPWSADNTLITYNEVSGHKAKWDGQGFDSDYNCFNTTIQYNYSHDNYGGFLLICNEGNTLGSGYNKGTKGTIVRYNISINDGIRPYPTKRKDWFSPVFHLSGPILNSKIHHNLVLTNGRDAGKPLKAFLYMDNWGGPWPIESSVHHNVFYVEKGTLSFSFGKDKQTQFYNNVFVGTKAKEAMVKPKEGIILFKQTTNVSRQIRAALAGKKMSKKLFDQVWEQFVAVEKE